MKHNLYVFISLQIIMIASMGLSAQPLKKRISNSFRGTASQYKAPLKPAKVICVTLPKCGTHLLVKCITLFGNPNLTAKYDVKHAQKQMNPAQLKKYKEITSLSGPNHDAKGTTPRGGEMPMPTMDYLPQQVHTHMLNKKTNLLNYHCPYSAAADKLFSENGFANFFIIRDPRAMLVSMAHMVKAGRLGEHAEVEKIIWDLVDGRKKYFVPWAVTIHNAYPLMWELGVTDFYKLFLPWMQAKKFYTVRFEDLIGNKGGGSDALQLQEITNIANHVGLTLSPEKIVLVRDQLFGGSTTFREGKIDGWKKYFTPEMKAAYKAAPGANQLLIDLGYEADDQW